MHAAVQSFEGSSHMVCTMITCLSWLVTASSLSWRLPVMVTMAPLSLKASAVAFLQIEQASLVN